MLLAPLQKLKVRLDSKGEENLTSGGGAEPMAGVPFSYSHKNSLSPLIEICR